MKYIFYLFIFISAYASSQSFSGKIRSVDGDNISFANIHIEGTNIGFSSDNQGSFYFSNLENRNYVFVVSCLGYETSRKEILINGITKSDIILVESSNFTDEIVVTGTRTFKRQTETPVLVSVISNKILNQVNACNLSEGLNFQTGIRTETDCQTCNYTQLRMNGLSGGYSQILINSRPIFSPLTGLYGMEQIPTNMIERIEVVKGGGSSLYGSSAIGGVVNIITKVPKNNTSSLSSNYLRINNSSNDRIISGNSTIVSSNKKFGSAFFFNNRNREWYDHNSDNFSELPLIKDKSFGSTFYFIPSKEEKLEMNIASINEYRYGGEMIINAPHFAMQSEERLHDVFFANADYTRVINDNLSFVSYIAMQKTERTHYTGIRPVVGTPLDLDHLTSPPYGYSDNSTNQLGVQINVKDFLLKNSVTTFGSEFVKDFIIDEIKTYNYNIEQTTKDLGFFLQSDLDLNNQINILSGFRIDKHNMLDNIVLSPRISMMYKTLSNIQFRSTWSTGFRAPQAFDADLHIAFAGGGVSRVDLSDNLQSEQSNSFSSSINYDKVKHNYIAGFTLESFYTRLENAFYLFPLGSDNFGDLFEKRNGKGATVKGVSLELRLNYNNKLQLLAGYTLQSSIYDDPVKISENLSSKSEFLRTPRDYGYYTLNFVPNKNFNSSINLVYTGKMEVIHLSGSPEQLVDEYFSTEQFFDVGIKSSYKIILDQENNLELSVGIKNIFNQYQNNFDSLENRDSNFIYGPSLPRTYFFGIKYSLGN